MPGVSNFFSHVGIVAGFGQGSGLSQLLAQWIIKGRPDEDLWPNDLRRFGAYADQKYTISNLNELLSFFEYDEEIEEALISPLREIEKIFDEIKKDEYEETNSDNKEFLDDLIIGKYFKLKFTPEIISSLHSSIEAVRNELTN